MHRSGICRLVLRRLRNLRQRRTCCFQLTTYKAIQMPTIHFLKKLFGKEFILFTLLCHTPDDLCSSTMPRAEFHNVKTPFFRNSAKLFLHPHFRRIFQICLFFFVFFTIFIVFIAKSRRNPFCRVQKNAKHPAKYRRLFAGNYSFLRTKKPQRLRAAAQRNIRYSLAGCRALIDRFSHCIYNMAINCGVACPWGRRMRAPADTPVSMRIHYLIYDKR